MVPFIRDNKYFALAGIHSTILCKDIYKCMLLTTYSSLCFGIVSVIGFKFANWMGPSFGVLSVLSVANHATSNAITRVQPNAIIKHADRCVAHAITLFSVYDALKHYNKNNTGLYYYAYVTSLGWVTYMFKIGKQIEIHGRTGELFHCSTHVVASIGCICLQMHTLTR